jgi:cytochrome b involved in lipid metabolism
MADLAKHTKREDVWLAIHDKVYSIGKYLDEHPGGEEVLMDRAGQNATEDFEDVGHSKDARKQLEKFEIGELLLSERSSKKEGDRVSGEGGGALPLILVSALVAAAGAAYYYYTTQLA